MDELFKMIARVFLRGKAPRVSLRSEIAHYRNINGGLAAAFDRAANEPDCLEMKMFLTWATALYAGDRAAFQELINQMSMIRTFGGRDSNGDRRELSEEELGRMMWDNHIRADIRAWQVTNPGIGKLNLGYTNLRTYFQSQS